MRSWDFQPYYFVIRCHPSFFGVTMKPFMLCALAAEQALRLCIQHKSKKWEKRSAHNAHSSWNYIYTSSFTAHGECVSVIPTGSLCFIFIHSFICLFVGNQSVLFFVFLRSNLFRKVRIRRGWYRLGKGKCTLRRRTCPNTTSP